MATLEHNAEADSGQALLRVSLTISAVWLVFWVLIGGIFFTVAGPGITMIGDLRAVCVAVFAPPAALLTIGLIGSEALSRAARPAGKSGRPLSRTIGLDRD